MLKIDNITKYYGELKAVDNLSFEVKAGEIFGLLGENGAGKTTTFRMIMNLIDPNSGKITLDNKKIDYDLSDKIGFLTEERSLLTKLTVKEQLLYYGALKSMKKEEIIAKMRMLLDRFGVSEYENRKINELSKGNQQKIQFISAIINSPKLLLLDEPFSGLDPVNIELFKKLILEEKKKGTAIIFSSHQMQHVEYFCEKLIILVKGKAVLNGNLSKIKNSYKQKNIFISGDVDIKKIRDIKGVISANKTAKNYELVVESSEVSNRVFDYVKTCKNITHYQLVEISLNDIFIDKVGESYGR